MTSHPAGDQPVANIDAAPLDQTPGRRSIDRLHFA
jgi:hypothetical protein